MAGIPKAVKQMVGKLAERGWLFKKIKNFVETKSVDKTYGLVGQTMQRNHSETKENVSAIVVGEGNETTTDSAMMLYSTNISHYLQAVKGSTSYLSQKMAIKNNDKATECYSHRAVLGMLRYLVLHSKGKAIILAVERKGENGHSVNIMIEIKVGNHFTSEDPDIDNSTFQRMKLVQSTRHRIGYALTNQLVTANPSNRQSCLVVSPGKNTNKTDSVFVYYQYIGHNHRTCCPEYLAAFRLEDTSYYITTDKNKNFIFTKHSEPPTESDDSRLFSVSKNDDGCSLFQPKKTELYWTVNDQNSMELQESNLNMSNKWFFLLPVYYPKEPNREQQHDD